MKKYPPILIGIFLLIIATWLTLTPNKPIRHILTRIESIGYDIQLRAQILTNKPLDVENAQVVIVDIDDKSIQSEGRWPWSRSTLAKLVDKLREQGAIVIAFDMFFAEPEENIADQVLRKLTEYHLQNNTIESILNQNAKLFDDDTVFQKSLLQTQAILSFSFLPRDETHNILRKPLVTLNQEQVDVLGITNSQGYITSIPMLDQSAKATGFINIFPDEDGIVRRVPLVMEYQKGVYPSLALQAVLTYLGETQVNLITPGYLNEQRLEGVRFGSYEIPTDENGLVYIPFIGKSYSFPYFSAVDILKDRIPKDTLLGKIVFVGTSATGLGDLQPASVENPFPGVEIQASIANGILQKQFSYKPAWAVGLDASITVILGLLAAIIFPYLGPRLLALIIFLFPVIVLYINGLVWRNTGLILSLLTPVILVLIVAVFNLLYGYLFETRRREQLKAMFGQYVPEKHINEMLKSHDKFSLHGEHKEMSVMFADIRNFTSISENMNATDLVEMLNTYFTPMTEIIHKNIGTVDKYIGDLIMAFWGAPLRDKKHATHAIQAAIQMQNKLKEMRTLQHTKAWPEIIMGIGINTGKMNVGDMGSQFRRNYTVLGDAVNLASRVESLTKYYNANIIITENTARHQEAFVFRLLDRVQVKGRVEGIDLYEVICEKKDITREQAEELQLYHTALNHYRAKEFSQAQTIVESLIKSHPTSKLYLMYLERIQAYLASPPPDSWNATYVHASK